MLGIAVTIDPTKVGVHVNERDLFVTSFGIYLPNITYAKGYQVLVRIIHEKDQFNIDIPAKKFVLTLRSDSLQNIEQHVLFRPP